MKTYWKVVFLVMISTLLVSCAAHQKGQAIFKPQDLSTDGYVQKVDNFLVILDASGSKQNMVEGMRKLEYAKDIISRMNQTIPRSLTLNSALRRYGKGTKTSQPPEMKTEQVYVPGQYSKARFDDALAMVKKPDGLTFMETGIDASSDDLKSFSGKTAVILVSDGKVHFGDPVQAAERLKSRYGENVCIHTIWVPSGTADINQVAKNKKLMEEIAKIGGACWSSVEAGNIKSDREMAGFVKKVFLKEKPPEREPLAEIDPCLKKGGDTDGDRFCNDEDDCPNVAGNVRGCPCADTDKDGVCNDADDCPNTPRGVAVDGRGCPVGPCAGRGGDTDNDGVCDDADKCPGTLPGVIVDGNGCDMVTDPCAGRGGDSDNDGVCDDADACPNTPPGTVVDASGCPPERVREIASLCGDRGGDADADTVCDDVDDCPNTPGGAGVNARGCWIIENLLFDYDKAIIRTKYYPDLDNVVEILLQNPYLNIEIQGHTCNIGSQKYNKPLSDRRAKAVVKYLIDRGIPAERLRWEGYGLLNPAASNKTEEGRELNRRVELHPLR
ncbi:OmpA family protein [Desulfobacterales bacterium HSG2]|nr:OmpA family protein [Desulfobacterales bacterium HSG2]